MRCSTEESFRAEGSFRARWIVPVTRPPIHGGFLRCEAGRLTHIGDMPPAGPVQDLGDVALLPGLINAHTHLEFSDLAAPILPPPPEGPPLRLAEWAEAVVRSRGASSGSDAALATARAVAIGAGIQESQQAGVVMIGEIATAPWPSAALCELAAAGPLPRLTRFGEVLGLSPTRQSQTWEWATALAAESIPGVAPGLSPHAPYSTPPELVHRAVDYARAHALPVAMHVAESREELQLLAGGDGPFRDCLERMGVWRDGVFPTAGGIEATLRELARAPRSLVVHGNYLTADQVAFLAGEPQMSVVYCPRTHAYFGHDRHGIGELWRAGVRVALGTDSRASNPDLSVWNEAKFLRSARPDLPPRNLLRAITADAADALGHPHLGRLEVGRSPGVVAIDSTATEAEGLFETIFEGETPRRIL